MGRAKALVSPVYLRETRRTRRDSSSGRSDMASSVIAACSSWCRRPDPVAGLAQNGGRDIVSDVWVCGRHLLNAGEFTRLDWPDLRARVNAWRGAPTLEDDL